MVTKKGDHLNKHVHRQRKMTLLIALILIPCIPDTYSVISVIALNKV